MTVKRFVMSRDLDYFTEFLADPSAYSFDDFFRIAKQWGRYILDHKDEFDYLVDDEWKEIRERLIGEFESREDEMDAVDEEWEEICEITDDLDNLYGWELVKFLSRRLAFMKKYQYYLNCPDESIAFLETNLPQLIESLRAAEMSELEVRVSKMRLDKAIAKLDENLVSYYERTGKILSFPSYPDKKRYKGN